MKKYALAIGIWMLIIPLAILNGGFRENVLNKLGAVALSLSGIMLSVCILLVAYFFIPKIKGCRRKDYIIIGILWFVLTNLFDLCMYVSEGGGFRDLLKSYDVSTGNLWILVVFTTLVAPVLVGKRRKNV